MHHPPADSIAFFQSLIRPFRETILGIVEAVLHLLNHVHDYQHRDLVIFRLASAALHIICRHLLARNASCASISGFGPQAHY